MINIKIRREIDKRKYIYLGVLSFIVIIVAVSYTHLTITMQKNIYLTTGSILRTESGKPLLEITADLTGDVYKRQYLCM